MNADKLLHRYQELQRYVGWSSDDAGRVRSVAPLLESALPALVDDFYAEIERYPNAGKVITGGPKQIERLKGTLLQWLRELLAGTYDGDYVSRRWKVGWRHVEIGLDQVYTNVALARVRRGLLLALDERWTGSPDELTKISRSLNVLLDLDLAIIEDAYQAEHLARSLRYAQEQALQSERLAAIGQMATGLAHESGNALARSQACLEMLALEVEDRPKALTLITRIQQAQDHLRQLYEDVRSYAAPIKLELEPWNLALIWRQAWENLQVLRQGKKGTLAEDNPGVDLHCVVDQFRLGQVFRNMLENSLAACPEPVLVNIHCTPAEIDGKPAIRIAVRDNGPGLNPQQRQHIFDPFFTTKTKGTGLGMAIAKRIVEAHGGRIDLGSGSGPGAEIILTIPAKQS